MPFGIIKCLLGAALESVPLDDLGKYNLEEGSWQAHILGCFYLLFDMGILVISTIDHHCLS